MDELFGPSDHKLFTKLYTIVEEFLVETDAILGGEDDPHKAVNIAARIDDLVYHHLRPEIWDRREKLRDECERKK